MSILRTTVRHIIGPIALLSICAAHAAVAVDLGQQIEFNIPAGRLSDALIQFSKQAHVQVLTSGERAATVTTDGVAGTRPIGEALSRLLGQSGLEFLVMSENAIAVRERGTGTQPTSSSHSGTAADGRVRVAQAEDASSRSHEIAADRDRAESPPSLNRAGLQVDVLDEVVVTGSRLKRSATEGPQPVNVYTSEDISRSGRASVGDFLNTLPEVDSTLASEATGFMFSDLSTVQLRGLPVGTTLVLVNGRDPGVTGVQEGRAFNLNNVPAAAVERIEIVPQGSSAIYGSDALAGVISIILKDDLQGLALDARYGVAADWNDFSGSAAWGKTWSRGSVTVVGSYLEQGRLTSDQRTASSNHDYRRFGGVDRRQSLCNPGSVYSVSGQNLPGLQAPRAGVPASATGRPDVNDFLATQGELNRCSNRQELITPREQMSLMLNGSYELGQSIKLRMEALYSTYDRAAYQGPRTFSRVPVPASNAFNPFGVDVLVDYAFNDLQSTSNREYDFERYLISAEGAVGAWEWESGAWTTRDLSDTASLSNNTRGWNTAAINAALASSDPSAALNLFAPGSAASPALLADLFFANTDTRKTRTTGVDAVLRGPLLSLPSGSLDVAVGIEYQKESIATQFHDADIASFSFDFASDRHAVFAEGRLPLLAGSQPEHGPRLAISAAVRRDEYTDVGGQTTPSVGLEWRPSRAWLVRGSYAEAFKAPGLIGLEGQRFHSIANAVDPRRSGESVTVDVTSGGNPDLVPEFGDATSIGIVWDSEVLPGLQTELTWWMVSLTDRIVAEPNHQLFIDNESLFADRVQRGPAENGLPGRIVSVDRTAVNLSQLDVEGFDFDLRYRFTTRFGSFIPRLRATRTYGYDVRLLETAPTENRLDKYSFDAWAHSWRATAMLGWEYGSQSASISGRYISEYRDGLARSGGVFGMLGDYWIVDANFRYELTDAFNRVGLSRAYISLGVNNLFDREPQFSNAFVRGYDGMSFDIRGRTLHASLGIQW